MTTECNPVVIFEELRRDIAASGNASSKNANAEASIGTLEVLQILAKLMLARGVTTRAELEGLLRPWVAFWMERDNPARATPFAAVLAAAASIDDHLKPTGTPDRRDLN